LRSRGRIIGGHGTNFLRWAMDGRE
jgi:hypothetical protein